MKHLNNKTPAFRIISYVITLSICLTMLFNIMPTAVGAIENESAMEEMISAIDSETELLDLTAYRLTQAELQDILFTILDTHPEFFYTANSFSYYTDGTVDRVTKIILSYRLTGKELTRARKDYENKLSALVEECRVEGGSDFDNVLSAHDVIVSRYKYDHLCNIYDAYGMLSNDKGVCQAYSMLYLAVLQRLGIECVVVSNYDMLHCWNMVKLDGEWYHIDTTWDDPVGANGIELYHDFFLVTDSTMMQRDTSHTHDTWVPNISASNKKYEAFALNECYSRFIYLDGYWYYINGSDISKNDFSAESPVSVYTIESEWLASEESYWDGTFSGLALYNGRLYFNTPEQIMSILPDGTDLRSEYTDDSPDYDIYGISVYDDELTYYCCLDPNSVATSKTISLTAIPQSISPETTEPEIIEHETTTSETIAPETTTSETIAPETIAPETTAPETTAPETTAPETTAPETTAPETTAPETTAPETTAPETTAPETTAPETTAPETTAPETTAPETTAPETTAPETTEPKTTEPETVVPDTAVPDTAVPDTAESTVPTDVPSQPTAEIDTDKPTSTDSKQASDDNNTETSGIINSTSKYIIIIAVLIILIVSATIIIIVCRKHKRK